MEKEVDEVLRDVTLSIAFFTVFVMTKTVVRQGIYILPITVPKAVAFLFC